MRTASVLPDGAEGARTPDLLAASQTLSQLSYSPSGRASLSRSVRREEHRRALPDVGHRERLRPDRHLVEVAGQGQVAGPDVARRASCCRSGCRTRAGVVPAVPLLDLLAVDEESGDAAVPGAGRVVPLAVPDARRRLGRAGPAVVRERRRRRTPCRRWGPSRGRRRRPGRGSIPWRRGSGCCRASRSRGTRPRPSSAAARAQFESGIVTKSSPSKRSAELQKKRPLIQDGSLASTPGVEPSWPWLPWPDQSRTTWPLPSFSGQ